MDVRSTDLAAYGLLVTAALAGLLLWSALPDSMATHFGVGGQPDDFVAKPVAVVLAPAIGLAAVLVTRYAPDWAGRTDPSQHVEDVTVVFVAGVIAYVQGFVYAWNLGYRVSPLILVVPVLLGGGLLVGYSVTRRGALG